MTVTDNDLYYLRSIYRHLREMHEALADTTRLSLGNEALADNIDWLGCFIAKHEGALTAAEDANMSDIVARLRQEVHLDSAWLAPRTSGLIEAAKVAAAEIERLRAALAWVTQVHPGRNKASDGAIVHMTWDEWNALRAALGLRPQPLPARCSQSVRIIHMVRREQV